MHRQPARRTPAIAAAAALCLLGTATGAALAAKGSGISGAAHLALRGDSVLTTRRVSGSTATAPVFPGECWGADREAHNVFYRLELKRGWKSTLSFTDEGRNVFQVYGPGLTAKKFPTTNPVASANQKNADNTGKVVWRAKKKGSYVVAVVGCKPRLSDPARDTTGAYSFRASVTKRR